jgi:hypothetical protein
MVSRETQFKWEPAARMEPPDVAHTGRTEGKQVRGRPLDEGHARKPMRRVGSRSIEVEPPKGRDPGMREVHGNLQGNTTREDNPSRGVGSFGESSRSQEIDLNAY